MNCSNCGFNANDNERFCPNCGKELSQKTFCPNCGSEILNGAKFCEKCGTKVDVESNISSVNKVAPASNITKNFNKRSLIYIALIAAALILVLFIGRCVGGGKPSPAKLEKIGHKFYDAIFDADIKEALKYVSKSAKDSVINDLNSAFGINADNIEQLQNTIDKLFKGAEIDVTEFTMEDGSLTVDGKIATAKFNFTVRTNLFGFSDTSSDSVTFEFIREGGKWKINDLN